MPHDPRHDEFYAANLARWDESVAVHVASEDYDVAGFLRGEKSLHAVELDEVGAVAGKTLLHLQCHFGMDTLAWARLGARVTGLDFSGAAVERARALAVEAGIPGARFVRANVYDAPEALAGVRFEVVYTGIGALYWLPDIAEWARVVAALLEPGGFLYVYDGHPMLGTLDEEAAGRLTVRYPYFETPQPLTFDQPYSYTDGPPLEHAREYGWNHGLGEIATALIEAGLRLDFVHEHRAAAWRALPWMERIDGEYARTGRVAWRLPAPQRDLVPLMFSMRATKPAGGGRSA